MHSYSPLPLLLVFLLAIPFATTIPLSNPTCPLRQQFPSRPGLPTCTLLPPSPHTFLQYLHQKLTIHIKSINLHLDILVHLSRLIPSLNSLHVILRRRKKPPSIFHAPTLHLSVAHRPPAQPLPESSSCLSAPTSHISISDVSAATFSDTQSPPDEFYGSPRDIPTDSAQFAPDVHPRVLMGHEEYDRLIAKLADPRYFNQSGTWSTYFKDLTLHLGPDLDLLLELAQMETNFSTSVYEARPFERTPAFETYRASLHDFVQVVSRVKPGHTDSFPICAIWSAVADKQEEMEMPRFLPNDVRSRCINAVVAWSKIMLAHRTYYCTPDCPNKAENDVNRAYIWNTENRWSIDIDWYTGGSGMAIAYDLLYQFMSEQQRCTVRSAIAAVVLNRFSWGTSDESSSASPNVLLHPHRIFSNWGGYHSNIYLTNLAIEHETGFDAYTDALLEENNSTGFNRQLDERYFALLRQFMAHSFYPDGSTFEDGYTYFTALREGSLGLLASHRRGSNVLGTLRFRNAIHNAVQMTEPWHCGNLIGHASGGGNFYNAHAALFRYVYPNGELPGMFWRLRYGNFVRNSPCRIAWAQSILQLAFLGGEHSSEAESPQSLPEALRPHFKLSYYSPRRGLLIARSSLSELTTYMHFDARPDAFLVGHDNADRGIFTFSALRYTWTVDLPWAQNLDSRRHSLLHVDGLAQVLKAPSVKMIKVQDFGDIVLAAADLTYAYNVQWSPGSRRSAPRISNTVYLANGSATEESVAFVDREMENPWSLGWPDDDRAADIGFKDSTVLYGVDYIGFSGLFTWKRAYRTQALEHIVRSMGVVRSNDVGYGFIVDSVDAGEGSHAFESYFILNEDVNVEDGICSGNQCLITLHVEAIGRIDVNVLTIGEDVSYRMETFGDSDEHSRIVIKSTREQSEEIWIVFYPDVSTSDDFDLQRLDDGSVKISTADGEQILHLDPENHSVTQGRMPTQAPSTTTTTMPPSSSSTTTLSVMNSQASTMQTSTQQNPTPTTPPLEPLRLEFDRRQRIRRRQSTTDRAQFMHATSYARQVAFNFTSSSREASQRSDLFNSCFDDTQTAMQMAIFDCGVRSEAYGNYKTRRCNLVAESTNRNNCDGTGLGNRFGVKLEGAKLYYLIISLQTDSDRDSPFFLRHGTTDSTDVVTALASPSSSPVVTTPVEAMQLTSTISIVVGDGQTGVQRERFLHDTDAPFQIVFVVRGKSDTARGLQDLFSACSRETTVRTEFKLFDCRDGYAERRCEEIELKRGRSPCRVYTQLTRQQEYYLAVSMYETGRDARLRLRHGRRRLDDM